MTRRAAVERLRENRQPCRHTGDVEAPGCLLHQQLIAARPGRRQEDAVRGVGNVLGAPEHTHEPLELFVVRLHVVVANRPIVAEAVERLRLEVAGAEAQRNATPVIRAPPDHPGPPPAELVALGDGVRLARDLPAADAPVELAEWPRLGGRAAARGVVRPNEHGRVGRVVPWSAGLEYRDVETGTRQDVGCHSTTGSRAHDDGIGW